MRPSAVLAAALGAVLVAMPGLAAEPLKVVASFSILGDLVKQVGGDAVAVTTLVGPNGDAHVFEPSPKDARAVAGADLLVVNGLGFEGWMDRLTEAAGYDGPIVVASEGVTPRKGFEEGHDHEHAEGDAGPEAEHDHDEAEHDEAEHGHDHGGVDPHAWQAVTNAVTYVGNIEAGLAAAAPAAAEAIRRDAGTYRTELETLDGDVRAAFADVPEAERVAITSHDAFGYYGRAYGLTLLAPVGLSTEAEPSAGDIARLIEQIKTRGAKALFVENIGDPRLIERIADESGVTVGGALYSDALSDPDGPAGTYVAMIRHNTNTIAGALRDR